MDPRPANPRTDLSKLEVVASEGLVVVKHPTVGAPLILFAAYSQPDPTGGSQPLFGVCHRLTLDACRVLTNHAANNQRDFLAKDSEGKNPVHLDDAKPLPPGDYFYFLDVDNGAAIGNYPIVKSFSAFAFPPQIPENWYTARRTGRLTADRAGVASSTNMSTRVASRDQFCSCTGYQEFVECAHLVPKTEAAWFMANNMVLYSPDNYLARVNAHTNGIALRDDVHRCLDSHCFVFYPAGNNAFMSYFVGIRGYPDYTELLHRRLATIHPSVAVEFLYARFAYTIIHLSASSEVFDSVPDNPMVKVWEDKLALEKAKNQAGKDTKRPATNEDSSMSEASASKKSKVPGKNRDSDSGCPESSFASNRPIQLPPEESHAERDARWKKLFFSRLPEIATLDEVEHPPDGVACHTETPHMLRLMSKYMRENPQVWQTSTTPEDATREDSEGFLADFLTRGDT